MRACRPRPGVNRPADGRQLLRPVPESLAHQVAPGGGIMQPPVDPNPAQPRSLSMASLLTHDLRSSGSGRGITAGGGVCSSFGGVSSGRPLSAPGRHTADAEQGGSHPAGLVSRLRICERPGGEYADRPGTRDQFSACVGELRRFLAGSSRERPFAVRWRCPLSAGRAESQVGQCEFHARRAGDKAARTDNGGAQDEPGSRQRLGGHLPRNSEPFKAQVSEGQ